MCDMRKNPNEELYGAEEVAAAAGVPVEQVRALIDRGDVMAVGHYLRQPDAVRLVNALKRVSPVPEESRSPLTLPPEPKRRGGVSLAMSGLVHAGMLALLLFLVSLGLLAANDTDQDVKDDTPIRLVYLMAPGPGGGGGGGGLRMPTPPPKAERKAPKPVVKKVVSSPIPPVRRPPPPPPIRPTPPPPVVEPPPPPTQVVQAPVIPVPVDPVEKPGTIHAAPPAAPPSNGPGIGGGTGTGAGTGMGEGKGSGIGEGSGGGTGGGPFQPGAGITPPNLLHEVKPLYTDEARRRTIEGDVVLEIVVRRDGSVGNVTVVRSLGAGLEQRAIDAVRQWKFSPAKRMGAAVDVVVEVSVAFKLR